MQPHRARRPKSQIDDPPANEWPAVIYPHNN
jgi:hypothetical protein